jgi:hypothetical protein
MAGGNVDNESHRAIEDLSKPCLRLRKHYVSH